jgi:hypothetical protein
MGLSGGPSFPRTRRLRAAVTTGRPVRYPRRRIGVVPVTRRSDIIKVFIVAALLGAVFYYLAHYGLSLPHSTS